MGLWVKKAKMAVDKIEQPFYYESTKSGWEGRPVKENETVLKLTEEEKRFLLALQDPEIGPKMKAYIYEQMNK